MHSFAAPTAQRAPRDMPRAAVAHVIDLAQLRTHIRTLITLDKVATPVVSCYINSADWRSGTPPPLFERRTRAIRQALSGQDRDHFEEPLRRIRCYLGTEIRPTTRGVAAFARAGTRPFFLGLQFEVPLPNRLSVNSTPEIFHLVELKDTYHRYVVLIATEERARSCRHCGLAVATPSSPQRCGQCDSEGLQLVDLKEVMVKLAERQSLEVEFVQYNDALMDMGGVACLLRYATPQGGGRASDYA